MLHSLYKGGDTMEIIQEHSKCELSCYYRNFKKWEGMFHWHDNYEICQVINKPCRFRIDGVIYNANPGDIVTINQQTVHQFLIDEEDTEIIIIQFHPKIFMSISYCACQLKTHITKAELESIAGLYDAVNSIISLLQEETNAVICHDNLYMQSLSSSLFFLLQKHFSQNSESVTSFGQRNDFYKIVDYINNNFCKDISVNSIASQFYFSRGKLSAVFKKYSGTGITEYIQALRIKNANMLLSAGSSVTDAAMSSGFDSIRTFNNTYRKITGITPSEYIKNK